MCVCSKPLRGCVFFRSYFFGKTRKEEDDVVVDVVVEQDVNRI